MKCDYCDWACDKYSDADWRAHYDGHMAAVHDVAGVWVKIRGALEGETIETAVVRYGGHSVQILELRFKSGKVAVVEIEEPQDIQVFPSVRKEQA